MDLKIYLKNNKISILIFLIIIFQNPIWPLWNIEPLNISFAFVFILFIFLIKKIGQAFVKSKVFIGFCLLLICFFLFPLFLGFSFSNIVYILTFLLIHTISDNQLDKAFFWLSRYFAIVLLISFLPWTVNTFISPLFPVWGELDLSVMKGAEYPMSNYLFYVSPIHHQMASLRFYSMFDEPGVVGTLAAFILYGNKYNFKKWEVKIIMIISLFTYSMAFYFLTAVGFAYQRVRKLNQILSTMMILITIAFTLNVLYRTVPEFQTLIVERINNASDNLDSRTNEMAKKKLESLEGTSEYFLGIGKDAMLNSGFKQGQSYELFILEKGFMAVLILLFCYYTFIRKKDIDSLFLLLLFFLSFLQRPFLFTAWQMLIFACCSAHIKLENLRLKNNSIST